ncbi:hypothetical protein INS49_005441 [Diaporthe citri]|uniref:uncharacterized protein n=1 Tax=Diaporthe citri TaxID=83186 RepID=UPI001C8047A0|nr:uncharacterized protein INS49_005441 [Diaporthe citri]KAG6353732.1 hypothetical protein INS49_005441 [Diaporthe citri]
MQLSRVNSLDFLFNLLNQIDSIRNTILPTIPSGSVIGEYLGRLHPLKSLPPRDRYVFVIPEIADVTANQFGNLTRFVNHHCNPNVTARIGMYGKRQVVLCVANQEIEAGEQLFVDYGAAYFSWPDFPCKCDAQDGDHLPSAARIRPRGAVAAESASVKASRIARDARAQRRDTNSQKTQTGVALEEAIESTKSPRKASGTAGKKQSRTQSTALNTLTRSAAPTFFTTLPFIHFPGSILPIMSFRKLPLILAAAMVLRSADAACIEDNCYGAMYWNPAGAEECSAHFITTVIPPPTTSTVTITSGIGEITTISGPFVGASTIVPSQVIPTYIVRACYGDVAYRFESACSCIGAGPTTTTAPQPVATNTVIIPGTSRAGISSRPLITASPVNSGSRLPEPIVVGPGLEPACLAVGGGSVIVTIQVDEFFAMSLTVSGPVFCIAEPTAPPAQSSQCNCASTLPSSAPFSSSRLAISNETSSDSFSTVFRTSYTPTSSERFSNYSTAASAEPTTSTRPEMSTPPETSSEFEPTTSSHSFLPFETGNFSTTEAPSSVEPSSVEPSSVEPSSVESSATQSSESSGPTPFEPIGPEIFIKISAGTLTGQYFATDDPDGTTITTNLKTHVTANLDDAAAWTLDRETGLLFQQIGDAWWAAYITFGPLNSYSSVLLLPADTVVGWLTEPVFQREPLRCTIDYSADFLLICGLQHGYTSVAQSERCGWTVASALNNVVKRACTNLQEVLLQAVVIYPEEQGISK